MQVKRKIYTVIYKEKRYSLVLIVSKIKNREGVAIRRPVK